MNTETITAAFIKDLLQDKIEKIRQIRLRAGYEPSNRHPYYRTDASGKADVKVALANCDLDFDLWSGLRNPATVGRYPLDLHQLWDYFAVNDVQRVRPDGSINHLRTWRSYQEAKEQFKRVLLISAMLPISEDVFRTYQDTIVNRRAGSNEDCAEAENKNNALLNEAMSRLAVDLYSAERAPLPLTSKLLQTISQEVVPKIHQGEAHGPCKEVHFSNKSLGVLTGLVQFGVSRICFRDELVNGQMERFIGPLSSMIIFDTDDLVTDGRDGVVHLTEDWYHHVRALSDFTQTTPEINQQRFCTFSPDQETGQKGCGLCVSYCPSGALRNSSPLPDGRYPSAVADQVWRFSDEALQFDYATCLEERTQKRKLYGGYLCGRCMVICGLQGVRRKEFFQK